LAVIKIDSDKKLPYLSMSDSSKLMIGETVIAIGNPFGLSHTVTKGVISALNRSLNAKDRVYNNFIQTDASINPGNSGGPLLIVTGELAGINTAIYNKAQGIGFAIPIDRARRVVDDLISFGEVKPVWIGTVVQDMSQAFRRLLNYPYQKGVIVADVIEQSPAKDAGFKRWDVIMAIDTKEITDIQDYRKMLNSHTAKDTLELKIFRDKKIIKKTIITTYFPAERIAKLLMAMVGFEVKPIDKNFSSQNVLYPEKGLLISSVKRHSIARRVGLKKGDILVQIDHRIISNMDDLYSAMAKGFNRETVFMRIQRGRYLYYLTLPMREQR